MTEEDETECVVIPDSQEIPTDHFPQAVVPGENSSVTWSRHVPDEPEGEQGQPVGQGGGAGAGEGIPEGGNEPGQHGGDAGVPPVGGGGGGGGGGNQGGAGGAGGNGGGGGGAGEEDNPEEDDDEGHEEEGYVTTTTSSSTGGSLPPLVPADPEAMLGQGYVPVLVSDEEHCAPGAGQMMHGDAPSEPEHVEEQAGGQELDSSESGGGLSEASTALLRGPESHGNVSSPSLSSASLMSPARASSRAISSAVSSLSSFSSSDEGHRGQHTPQPSTSGAQRKRPSGRRGDPVAAKRQKLDVSSSTDTSGRETSGHDTTSSATTTTTSDTSHDDAPGRDRSPDSGGGRRHSSYGGDDPSGDRKRKPHQDPSGGSCGPSPGPSGVGQRLSDRLAYGTAGGTLSFLDEDVRESMVVETLSLSQEDAESLSCIPPSQNNGRLPFLGPDSPTDHETTVIECDIESTVGFPATSHRGTNPQEFPEWQSMSIMDYGSFENNGQKVETDGSQQAIDSLTFGRVSQSTNDDDDSVQFMGFENGKSSGVPSQVSGGFENTNLDLRLTQTQDDDAICPPTTSVFSSGSQLSTCPSSQDPGFLVAGPQPASDVSHQQRNVVLFPSSSSSSRSDSVSSNKQDDDLHGSKPNRPLIGTVPSIKDLWMDVESSKAENPKTKNPVDKASDISNAKEHQTVLKFADTSDTSEKPSGSSSKKAKPRSSKKCSSKGDQKKPTDCTRLGNENDQTDQCSTSPNSVPESLVEDTQEYQFTAVKAQVRKSVEAAPVLSKNLSDPQSIVETDIDDAKDHVETPVSMTDHSILIRSLSASQSRPMNYKNKNGDSTKCASEALRNQVQDMPQKNSKFVRHGSNQLSISTGKVHVTMKVKNVYEEFSTYLMEYNDGKLINVSLTNEERKLLKHEIETFEDILSPVSISRSGLSLSSGDLADVSSLEHKSSAGSFKSGSVSTISPIAPVSTPAKGKPESLTADHSDGVVVESILGNDATLNLFQSLPHGGSNLDRESVTMARVSAGTRRSSGSNRFSEVLFSDVESERASFGKNSLILRRSSESLFSSMDHLSNRNSAASTRVSDIARVSDISARVSDISARTSDVSNRVSDASVRSDTIVEEASVTLCKSGSPAGGRVSGDDAIFRQPLPPLVKRRSSGSTSSSGGGGLRRDSGAVLNQVEPSGKLTGNQDPQLGTKELELVDRQEASSTSGMITSSMESVIPNTCPSTGANLSVKDSRGGLNDNSRVTAMEVSEVPEHLSETNAAFLGADLSGTTVEAAEKTPAPGSSKRFPYRPAQSLDQGTPVMALWKDKHYYPAQVLSCGDRGKYSVLFDDGNQMDVKASHMISLDLVPVGKLVLADCGSGWNELVTVLSYWTDGLETGYVVRRPLDSEDGSCDVKVRRSQISLSREQAASIVPEIRTPASAVKNSGTSEKKKRTESQGQRETSSSLDAYKPRIQPFMINDKSEHLESGVPVFAKWSDRHFYPGHLKAVMSSDAFVVTFEDGNESRLSQSSVFVCDLLPSGLDVMAEKENGNWSEEATVVGHYRSDGVVGYVVKFADGSDSRVSRKGVTLNQTQAIHLLNQMQSHVWVPDPSAPIGLDNAPDSKRKRPRGTSPRTTPATNPPARASQRPRNQHKMQTPLTADRDSGLERPDERGPIGEPSSALGSTTSSRKKKTYVADLNPKASSTPTPNRYKDSGSSSKAFKTVVDSPDMAKKSSSRFKTSLFPIQSGSLLFSQMTFILTHVEKTAEQREKERKILVSSPGESSTSGVCIMSSLADDVTVPFDKGFLCQQIEANGGEVMDEFDLEKVGSGINCFLVSDACQRTRKYFCALAVGIPCVSHLWIQESCARGLLEDFRSYMLPSGISLETNQLIPWQNVQRPLAGLTIVVTTENRNFIDVWMEILEAAGCNLAPKIPARSSASQVVHVVISDNHISAATYQLAQKRGIPVVSSEWVVQCLVTGCKVNYNDHPKYRHDYE